MTEVLVPPLGQTVDTLTLVSWYKSEGEAVIAGEPLYAVETDKATLDVEAPASGVLCGVTAQPGDVVKVLSAIAVIEAKAKVKVEAEPVLALTSALTSTSPSRLFVSPRARRLAEGEGVDLAEIKATGPEGAIVERDVRAYLQGSGIRGRSQETGVRSQGAPERSRNLPEAFHPWRGGWRWKPDWIGKRSPAPAHADRLRGRMWRRRLSTGAEERRGRGAVERRSQASFQQPCLLNRQSSFQLPASHSPASAPSSLSAWSPATARLRR